VLKVELLKIFFIGIFFLVKLLAQDDIDKEIEKILKAPVEKRRELMNRLKLHIQTLNQDKQFEAIERLKEHMLQTSRNNENLKERMK